MKNKELFNELNELCEKYGFVEVQSILKGLGLREFENENKPSIGEKLSDVIDDIVFEKEEYEKWKKRFILNEDNEEYEFGLFDEENYKKSIKENQMKVLNVIME